MNKRKVTAPRVCEVCNSIFTRPNQYPISFFNRKRTCSKECYGVLRKNNVVGFQKGHKPFSDSHRFAKGQDAWNRGIKGMQSWHNITGLKPAQNKGKKCSPETINRIKIARARQNNDELPHKEKHWNWKGGITKFRIKVMQTNKYKLWRTAVFERDNYTCQHCGFKGFLQADHIKPYSEIIQENNIKTVEDAKRCNELWDVLNGRTLCVPCHRQTHTFGGRMHKKHST